MAPSGTPKERTTADAPASPPATVYAFGDFELDAPLFELRRAGDKVRIEPKVLDLLLVLVRSRDRIVQKSEILETLWPGVTVSEASIWRVVLEARRALGDAEQRTIVTVRGRGFRFAANVTESPAAAREAPTHAPTLTQTQAAAPDRSFVGREAALAAVGARLTEAMPGRGSLVWLSGEAGIGKTRMADEIAQMARGRGATVLTAHAHLGIEVPPLQLWADLVRKHTRDRSDDASKQLLAAAGPLLRGEEPKEPGELFALFEAVSRSFADPSRERPLVVVIDDLHAADEPSLRLLELLAREVRHNAWLIAATYRDGAVPPDGRGHALGGLIASTGSLAIPLRRFSLKEVARLVEVHTGTPPSSRFAEALLDRSGGNPLYLEQLLKTEWAEGALRVAAQELASTLDLQRGLIETVGRHLDGMSGPGRELLTLAAVLGKEFQLAELAVASGLAPELLLDHVDEAVRASVLVPAGEGRHRFSHVLVRDVLYRRVSSAERVALHRRVGEALLAHYGDAIDAYAGQVANHLLRGLPGADPERAIELGMRAAERQAKLGRYKEAAKLWVRTATALSHLSGGDARRVTVQLGLAKALEGGGPPSEAREAFLDAAVLAETFRCPQQLAEAALGYAALDGDVTRRRALLEQSLTALASAEGDAARGLKALVRAALDGDRPE
ncbi:MAG TPA: AAA family ATPase [Polyangiaceae bacterium]|jgi:DNA-binding winged helix-turn-helix (wHTH) protein